MIWLQPRALKSITVAVAYPCWRLGLDPRLKIMVATYGDKLSRDHAENRRSVMESRWYRAMFPATRISTRGNRVFELVTTRGGQCLAITVGGAVTGRGADVIIIIDDCMKGDEQYSDAARENLRLWFTSTLASRLNDKASGAIISIQQRLHEDDLPAFLSDRGYACLSLPAISPRDQQIEIGDGIFHEWRAGEPLDPIRFPLSVLESERLVLGAQTYSAQYLQNPVAPEGNLLRMEQFRYYDVVHDTQQVPAACLISRPSSSWSRPRLPISAPRCGTATISFQGVTRLRRGRGRWSITGIRQRPAPAGPEGCSRTGWRQPRGARFGGLPLAVTRVLATAS